MASGIEQTTHMADLVSPKLQGRDSALKECEDKVLWPKLALLGQLLDLRIRILDLAIFISWVILKAISVSG